MVTAVFSRIRLFAAMVVALLAPLGAHAVAASPTVFYDTLTGGATQFANTVTGANGTVNTQVLSGLATNVNSWTQTDFTITASNNANRSVTADASLPINGDGISMNAAGAGSGLTFTFNSPVNAFSMELQGWATCCLPSSLYIVFDGGTPILVGTANSATDNPGHSNATTFIGAIDDSNTFSAVTFYGLSSPSGGDALNGGGTIRWATLAIGALSGGGYVNTATSTKGLASYLNANEVSGTARATLASHLNSLSQQQVDTAMLSVFPTVGIVGAQTTNATAAQATSMLLDRAGTVLGGQLNGTRNFFQKDQYSAFENPAAPAAAHPTGMGFATSMPAGGYGAPLVSRLDNAEYPAFQPGEYAVWMEANTGTGQGERTTRTLSYTSDNQGMVMGVETALDARTLVGVLLSPNQTQVKLADEAGKTDIDTYIAGLYAQRLFGQTKLTGTLNLASSRYKNTRNVDTGSGISSALAEYGGHTVTAAAGLSRLYKQGAWQVEPFAQGQFVYGRTQNYAETGAGTLNMQVDGSQLSQAALSAGVTLKRSWQSERTPGTHTFAVRPSVRQGFELDGADTSVSFIGSGSNVLLPANSLNQTDVQLGANYQYSLNNKHAFTLGYDTAHSQSQHSHSVMVGYGYRF